MIRRPFEEQLERIKALKFNWADDGSLPIRTECIVIAELFAKTWHDAGGSYDVLFIAPVADGTVQIEIEVRGKEVEIDIASAKDIIVYFYLKGTEETATIHSYTKDRFDDLVRDIFKFM